MHQRNNDYNDIYASAPLRRLRDEQTRLLVPALQRSFGTHALLLGAFHDDAPPALPMLGCWTRLHLGDGCYRGDLQAAIDEPLPFVDDAFELVLMRNALEVAPTASALLAEAVRVLIPGGVLTLTGVHPLSAWAPWFYWRTRSHSRTLQMPLRLERELKQAGMEIERVQRVGATWPGLVSPDGPAINPLGGGYVLIARKRHRMATPLRIKLAPVRVPANSQLSPGTRRDSAL